MGLVRSTRARGSVGFLGAFAVVCRATQEVEALAKIRPVLSARGDGGGVCGGLGRRQLDRVFCSAITVSSVGFFCSGLAAGPNCASHESLGGTSGSWRVQLLQADSICVVWIPDVPAVPIVRTVASGFHSCDLSPVVR